MRPADRGIAFRSTSMSDLQQFLSALPSMDRPVIDNTSLASRFDFTLELFGLSQQIEPGGTKGAAASASESVYADALEKIGLRLEAKTAAIETIVIRHAEKPGEN